MTAVLVHKNVKRTLFSMAFPMLAGTFAMNAYNLTDTWFVSRLGTLPLAAMGFTFPVVMLLTFIAGGIGTGVTTLVSHAIGRHDHDDAARLTAHGLALTIGVTAVLSVAGSLLIQPVFTRLGADHQTLGLIGQYMRTWYAGAVFMTLPMLGNGILISCGDSKSAARFMMLGTLLNLVLDPVMIFGWGFIPAMGIRGAALATVMAQAVSTAWLMVLFSRKHRLLNARSIRPAGFLFSLCRITGFALPAILSMVLMPISATVITRIISQFGVQAVAAIGAAARIEMFAFMIPMALGMSLTPFISQNFGAGRLDRVKEARTVSSLFAMGYGALIAAVFFWAAPAMASAFTTDPDVARTLVLYSRVVSFGYGMMEVHRYCGFFLTGLHKPFQATLLNILRVLVLLIPLSYFGAHLWQIPGLFAARLVTDLLVGGIGLFWISRTLHAAAHSQGSQSPLETVCPQANDRADQLSAAAQAVDGGL